MIIFDVFWLVCYYVDIEWGKGSVQKEIEIEKAKDAIEIANGAFAQLANDPKLEKRLKERLREDDPMYEYYAGKQAVRAENERSSSHQNSAPSSSSAVSAKKPLYKGPNVIPNRFDIGKNPRRLLPGYRWDGVDRGNKFEKRLLIRMNEKQEFREEEYKWSVADM